MTILRATTFKDSSVSFLAALEAHGIKYSVRTPSVGIPMASGLNIEILVTGGWATLAIACLAWAHARKSRRISVTTQEHRSVLLEGYSAQEAEKILSAAIQVAAIDTKPADDR